MNTPYTLTIRGVGIVESHPTELNDADHQATKLVQTLGDNEHDLVSATITFDGHTDDIKDQLGYGPSRWPTENELGDIMLRTMKALGMPFSDVPGEPNLTAHDMPAFAAKLKARADAEA